jgi:hypothetical protein
MAESSLHQARRRAARFAEAYRDPAEHNGEEHLRSTAQSFDLKTSLRLAPTATDEERKYQYVCH